MSEFEFEFEFEFECVFECVCVCVFSVFSVLRIAFLMKEHLLDHCESNNKSNSRLQDERESNNPYGTTKHYKDNSISRVFCLNVYDLIR
jgi:hypothetical protein